MLAFLGAIICIIASVHPAGTAASSSPPSSSSSSDNDSAAAALLPPADKGLGALHGPAEALASAGPRLPGSPPPLFSRFVCTPLSAECPAATGPGTTGPEELLALRSAAAQLRRTALEQKERIRMDQETIRELTGKLSRCEGGFRAPQAPAAGLRAAPKPGTMGHPPAEPPAVRELEEAVRALQDRIERIEQELPARANGSVPTTPALARDALHTKMEQLEEQLLSKILTLQKERQAANSDRSQQQHDIEKELNSLQSRVAELEHGSPGYSPPDAFKVTIPVQNNYMYARMKKSLPELYAFTICMWLKSKALAGLGTPFSYSVPSQANEIVLLEWGTNPLELLINDKVAQLPLSLKDKAWHHICVAWTTRDGKWSAYQDGEQRGAGENLASWHAIKPQGVIILGQEQVPSGPWCTGLWLIGSEGASLLANLTSIPFPIPRTRWAAALMPHRPSWGSWRSSACGTTCWPRRRSWPWPTAPPACRATSSSGTTRPWRSSGGPPRPPSPPVRRGGRREQPADSRKSPFVPSPTSGPRHHLHHHNGAVLRAPMAASRGGSLARLTPPGMLSPPHLALFLGRAIRWLLCLWGLGELGAGHPPSPVYFYHPDIWVCEPGLPRGPEMFAGSHQHPPLFPFSSAPVKCARPHRPPMGERNPGGGSIYFIYLSIYLFIYLSIYLFLSIPHAEAPVPMRKAGEEGQSLVPVHPILFGVQKGTEHKQGKWTWGHYSLPSPLFPPAFWALSCSQGGCWPQLCLGPLF
uniref:Neuronal pentraxin receptor n=2 Tax=Anas platyrhynchos TaxID=8839 RepID=A0A493TEP3_ANAPP